MAEGIRFNTDGTVLVAVDGKRHTLRVPTLGDLEDLRTLFRDLHAEREDYIDLTYRPDMVDLQGRVKQSTEAEERKVLRKELRVLQEDLDHQTEDAWATWWRDCFDRLCRDDLPDFADRESEGLPVWMLQSPDVIGELFAHWRVRPSLASGGDAATQGPDSRTG